MLEVWTSQINVMGDDGKTLLYGRVVDLAADGLYIDLLCPNRRREFIPFHRVFLSKRADEFGFLMTQLDKTWTSVPVEVLSRKYPGGAWRWWPGELVNPCPTPASERHLSYALAVVQGQDNSGATWTDIVGVQHIRWPVPGSWWTEKDIEQPSTALDVTLLRSTGPGRLVKCCPPLPPSCQGASAAQLLKALKEPLTKWMFPFDDRVVSVDFADGQVQYVVELSDGVEYAQSQDAAQHSVQSLHNGMIERLPDMLRRRAVPAPVEVGTPEEWRAVAFDVWQQVFSYVDTLTQTRLRAVCSAWNAILDTPGLTGNVFIDSDVASGQQTDLHYTLTVPIFKTYDPLPSI
ncbi:uncharacterized protein LOC129600867 [Paramacrobiotus metropolitanus]|uniref:uncharacterized protein LOC129600867 n=1 Tax=Paramacrobiotus metropolitanus TaxID=2943436 RepID=UPI002445F291|nr:uncharacterized protein LOC129600867 [Paramacrobiotus metropolitanus]